jgi:endonuclease/exonuclease/phosphatase (EEP) superfamily protein YafD
VAALAVAAGFAGFLHPAGDSIAVFRIPLSVLGLAAALLMRPTLPRLLLIAGQGAVLAGLVWGALRPDWDGSARLTLYQQNLLFSRPDNAAWLAEVTAREPDVLTLQEVSERNLVVLDALRARYPFQLHCPLWDILGEAVLSRYPFVEGTQMCSDRDGLAAVQIAAPAGAVWIVSLHVSWPWPHGQAGQLDDVLPMLDAVDGPVVVAGDFNAVAWSHALDRVGARVDAQRIGRLTATFALPYGGMPVGIDHVLSSGQGRVTALPRLGSDHRGLWAELDPWLGQSSGAAPVD